LRLLMVKRQGQRRGRRDETRSQVNIIGETATFGPSPIKVKNIMSLTNILNTLRSWRSLRCMILVTAKSAKSAKIV
jgi:hypothetical protein